jgi:uncharacterized protein YraI
MQRTHSVASPRLVLALVIVLASLLPAAVGAAVGAALWPTAAYAQEGEQATVTAGVVRLNVRSGPGTENAIVGGLAGGTALTILETSSDGGWFKVQVASLSEPGWVSAQFVTRGGAAAPAAPAGDAPASTGTVHVIVAAANIRSGPGTGFARIAGANNGTTLETTGTNDAGDWYRIKVPGSGAEGWIAAFLVSSGAGSAPVAGAPAAPVAGQGYDGGFGYGVTANMWHADKAGVASAVKDLGFGWVKQQVRWEFVEPSPGAVDWGQMDDIVNTMNGQGINVAFSVVTAPPWSRPTKGGSNGPPEDFQAFANFLGAVAGRYCGQSLKALEVWNEQNLRREWEGFDLNPAVYMDLLKRSYNSIKTACPSMLVISGATTPAGYSDVAFDDIDYLRGMYQNGLAAYSDGVGIHPSGFANPPGVRFSDWQAGTYNADSHVNHRSFYFLSTLEESRAVMVQNGDSDARLWPTEFGWGSTQTPYPGYEYQARISEQQQAEWITEAFRIMANSGYVGGTFLWNLNYDYDEMATFAIQGRPAYQALKAMMGR